MIRYDTPIVKSADEMKPGDIFRCEYGEYGNWCEFVFESCNKYPCGFTQTHFHRIGRTQSETCYRRLSVENKKRAPRREQSKFYTRPV